MYSKVWGLFMRDILVRKNGRGKNLKDNINNLDLCLDRHAFLSAVQAQSVHSPSSFAILN